MSVNHEDPIAAAVSSLTGTVEKITYHSEETGYTVLKLELSPTKKRKSNIFKAENTSITCVGTYVQPKTGAQLKLVGSFRTHPRFGQQFHFTSYEEIVPSSKDSLVDYLCSGYIEGVQKTLAKRIVNKFGKDTIHILDTNPERLREINGIGAETCDKIVNSWNQHKQARDLVLLLKPHGFSVAICAQILKVYQQDALTICQTNPYKLALDIQGVSFHMADTFAKSLNFAPDHPLRREAYVIHCLQQATRNGNVYLPQNTLETEVQKFLGISHAELDDVLTSLLEQKRICVESSNLLRLYCNLAPNQELTREIQSELDTSAIYLRRYYDYEMGVAQALARILNAPKAIHIHDPVGLARSVIKDQSIELALEQQEAVIKAAQAKILVVTGGPGTGKTTIINTIIKLFATQNARILLAAPTGRAARRMFDATGQPAKTIHRMLEYSPLSQDFTRNSAKLLECDLLIVDEASMLDIGLAYHLLQAIPDGCTLLLVGDIFQLPSVGPGAVLSDIINSQVVPIVKLTQIFRQSAESAIVRNAHLINQGQLPPPNEQNTDFFFIQENDPVHSAQTIADLVAERLPKCYDFDILNDIQVLSPMHKGEVGISALNALLQQRLNPNGTEIKRGEYIYRLHDKVMQIHNDYEKDVFNGDSGVIHSFDLDKNTLTIRFEEDKLVNYKFDELDDIIPAYAISIHKSQGSEYPCVIIPMSMTHFWMLERNLIYTAVTRGKKIVIVIGEHDAFARAVHTNTTRKRFSRLWLRLVLLHTDPSKPQEQADAN